MILIPVSPQNKWKFTQIEIILKVGDTIHYGQIFPPIIMVRNYTLCIIDFFI